MNADFLTSFEALRSVYIDGAYSNLAINEAVRVHSECSAGFVRTAVKGTIRNTILLDYYIDMLAKNGVKKIKNRTLVIIRLGIYSIMEMDSIPDRVAVSETVALAKKVGRGSEGFVNAILRSFLRKRNELELPDDSDRIRYLSTKYSYNEKLAAMFIEQYGHEEGVRLMEAMNRAPELSLRCNSLKTDRDDVIAMLAQNGITATAAEGTRCGLIVHSGSPVSDRLFDEGIYSVQGISSISAVECLSPERGSRVLDMCAAPGGKSAAIAEMMDDDGTVVSCDIYEHRLRLIEENRKRLGIGSIETELLDGTVRNDDFTDSFDYVLADVPCSGLGVIGSKPEIKIKADPDGFEGLYDIQKRILQNAFTYTKPGGYFMYSTCTLNRHENDEIIDDFLQSHLFVDAEIVEKDLILPYNNHTGFFYCKMRKFAER